LKDIVQEVVEAMGIPEGDGEEPLNLVGRLRKVPETVGRFMSQTGRQYVGHV
jgi:hypothetical protein